ncbi:ATP-binding protein [Lutimaribacter sp. EGI FJ00015]|uniref:ATP-binding protein n=1 Tax=Lutimaribacter degradans TaxID=2945989 RepID=A0ACC5ZZV4_9RHOB|nr:ATP-binding protein [Lutimaribacter sp. EGI FJ00013]MCM2563728.1 ATP-binding protein [Lutimaribacter sp. EGI FJ00013]MCO0614912.1 ATP-binding protein [Lutimaribacter sp. EGI FJ00015]MCO0637606.1 ATP-binding protein [Lutimaribacter sp. EGI FJ00014]
MTQAYKLVLRNRLEEIPRIAETVERFCLRHELAPRIAMHLTLALDELATNAISHGFAPDIAHADAIRLSLTLDDDAVQAVIEDRGRPFDPLSVPPTDTGLGLEARAVGGLGVHLVREVMDEVRYERTNGLNRVYLRKRCDNEK